MSEIVVDYTPAERVDGDDMFWEQFEGRLSAVLGRMAAGSFLILSSRADDEIVYSSGLIGSPRCCDDSMMLGLRNRAGGET